MCRWSFSLIYPTSCRWMLHIGGGWRDTPLLCKVLWVSRKALYKCTKLLLLYHLLFQFENACFELKQKQAVFVLVSLNANELLLSALFSRIGLCLDISYRRYSAKKTYVLIIMSIMLKTCVLMPYQFKRLIYCMVFWEHTSEGRTQKAAVTWHVSGGAPIRIFEADHRSQKAVSADPITDTDLFKAFFLSCRILYSDDPIKIFWHLFRAWISFLKMNSPLR